MTARETVLLEKSDLENVARENRGNRLFAQALDSVKSEEDLLRLLARYIHFNSTFGAGVANLAGEIGVRQDLFREANEPLEICADRSMEVASAIFFAAVDEFDDRATAHHDTHRSLAQATLKATGSYFGYTDRALADVATLNPSTQAAIAAMRTGYAVNQSVEEVDLFRAIGFHIGSEVLADEEFRLLDGFLRERFPKLVTHLESATVEINDAYHAAYFWIRIHTSVEVEHFDHAVQGANSALRYYAGTRGAMSAKADILAGVGDFDRVQTAFMAGLLA